MKAFITVDTVVSRLKSRFGIEADPYETQLSCLEALRQMQIFADKDVYFIAKVKNFTVKIDDDVQKVLFVCRHSLDVQFPRIIRQPITHPQQFFFRIDPEEPEPEAKDYIENVIPHIKGPYIDFNFKCPYVSVNEDKVNLLIKAKGFAIDKETRFIKIPESALEGCVHFSAFVHMQPLYLMGRIPENVMNRVETWLNQNLEFSRNKHIYKSLNQNNINDVMNIQSSHDRKNPNVDA